MYLPTGYDCNAYVSEWLRVSVCVYIQYVIYIYIYVHDMEVHAF